MQSETQRVREEKPSEQPAENVRPQAAIDEPNEVTHDHKTFRSAVVIGLVIVGIVAIPRKIKPVQLTYEMDLTYCKGCGICSVECKVGAIVMKREEGDQ